MDVLGELTVAELERQDVAADLVECLRRGNPGQVIGVEGEPLDDGVTDGWRLR
ncbi:hypothetical protein ACH35V_13285 [Actinomadura sp. 1N219]|uniref:hypothetical protein n=1 Tax=Actinomadura sp. 1N219 TaxID=3375152 RepID=UPI0037B54D86